MCNIQYLCTRYKFTVQTCENVQYPKSMYKVDNHCTKPMGMSNFLYQCNGRHSLYKPMGMCNVQYLCTRYKFNVQTYENVQYPISMYKVDIHWTKAMGMSIFLYQCNGRQSLYKPRGMSNIQYRKKQHLYSLYKHNMWMSNIQYQTNFTVILELNMLIVVLFTPLYLWLYRNFIYKFVL